MGPKPVASEDQTGFSPDDRKRLELNHFLISIRTHAIHTLDTTIVIIISCVKCHCEQTAKASPVWWSPNQLGLMVSGQGPSHSLLQFPNTHTHTHIL